MNKSENRPKIGVGVVVLHDGKILLGQRKNAHGLGKWGFPGGHLEFGETVLDCAKRELLEETGLEAISLELIDPWSENVMEDKHYITLFVLVEEFKGEPQLLEPEKCVGWEWFDPNDLPEPLFDPIPSLLEKVSLHEPN